LYLLRKNTENILEVLGQKKVTSQNIMIIGVDDMALSTALRLAINIDHLVNKEQGARMACRKF